MSFDLCCPEADCKTCFFPYCPLRIGDINWVAVEIDYLEETEEEFLRSQYRVYRDELDDDDD